MFNDFLHSQQDDSNSLRGSCHATQKPPLLLAQSLGSTCLKAKRHLKQEQCHRSKATNSDHTQHSLSSDWHLIYQQFSLVQSKILQRGPNSAHSPQSQVRSRKYQVFHEQVEVKIMACVSKFW